MFTKSLEHIFTLQNLKNTFLEISSNTKGIDEVSYASFKNQLSSNINDLIKDIQSGTYTPEPLKKVEIPKPNSNEKRPIALSSIKDKLVQRVLYIELNDYFDGTFSNKSYAYRKNKSTLKAINRVSEYIKNGYCYVLKTDIDNFFENINHEKLIQILEKHIVDKRIIRLIIIFFQTGSFKKYDYLEHEKGVHQGDILSPLLSNIYLDLFDKFLENRDIVHVRYADDFVVLTKKESQALDILNLIKKVLETLKLELKKEKTYIRHINNSFTFLGVIFTGKNRNIDNDRLEKSFETLHKLSKTKVGFKEYIEDLNDYLNGLKNYYLKIIHNQSSAFKLLQNNLIDSISHKVYLLKSNKKVKTKKEFRIFLANINLEILFEEKKETIIELILAKAYTNYLANKNYTNNTAKIDKKKNLYSKKFALDSTLHISKPALALGISRNKFVLKEYGKIYKSFPKNKIDRIIVDSKGISLSSNVIQECAKLGISIDFIDKKGLNYASLITYKASITQMIHKQAKILNTPLQLQLATEFIKTKAKNQINYLKYLNKYHKILDKNIEKMYKIEKFKIKKAKNNNELMGYEGNISALYWESLRLILDIPFEKRITYGAKDIVNSSLNYAYAILYGKVQHYLVHCGLSLNISFLHSLDKEKPTLTFDMIEEFRTFMVDRTIISMFNKNEPIKLNKEGLLTKNSRQLIAKNIKEKLGSYTMWKKSSIKCENIIKTQCFLLANVINSNDKKYKGFIGKY